MSKQDEILEIRHTEVVEAMKSVSLTFEKFQEMLLTLPADVAKELSKRIEVDVHADITETVELKDGSEVTITGFDGFMDRFDHIEMAMREYKEAIANQSVKIANADQIKPTVTLTLDKFADELKTTREVIEKLVTREVKVVVKSPDEIKFNWPRQAKDAIPVVLTTKDRKEFYDAIAGAVSASYKTYQLLGLGADPVSDTNPLPVGGTDLNNRYAGGKTPYAKSLTASENINLTNALNHFEVYWVSFIPDPDNTAANLITIAFSDGTVLYKGWAIAHWELFVGAVGSNIVITLENAQPVAVNIHYKEKTP